VIGGGVKSVISMDRKNHLTNIKRDISLFYVGEKGGQEDGGEKKKLSRNISQKLVRTSGLKPKCGTAGDPMLIKTRGSIP